MTESSTSIQPHLFRSAMGTFATGVTVVTVRTRDGDVYGMTVNAFSSVSLDPPLVLVCLADPGRGAELVTAAGVFTVNVLCADQVEMSARFANRRRPTDASMFDGLRLQWGSNGCPTLLDAAAHFECRVQARVPAGDHVIVIGHVVSLTADSGRPPLVFHEGGYRALAASGDASAAGRPLLRAV